MKNKVLIFAPSPPPFAGPEVATEMLLKNISTDRLDYKYLKSNLRKENWQKGKMDFTGIYNFFFLYLKYIINLILYNPSKVYLLLSSGKVGFLRDAVLISSAKLLGKKVIAHYRGGNFHNFYKYQTSKYKRFILRILNKIDCIIVQADILKGIFSGLYDLNKVKVLYNGIELKEFKAKNKNTGTINLFFMGHISYSKGFFHLVEAYKQIYKDKNVSLQYAGTLRFAGETKDTQKGFLSGEGLQYFEEHEKMITNAIQDFVINSNAYNSEYLGIIKGDIKEKAFRNADIFILPSFTEGFSFAVLEAMQRGLPVITTKVGALPEVVKDGINGFLIDETNIGKIKEVILRAIKNRELLKEISDNNILYVKEEFDVIKIAKQFENILNEQ